MASRMDKYYDNDVLTTGRSSKNKSLYEQIQNLDTYTNIEGVATIENNNEIDISRVRKMLNNRENYKKERELKTILRDEEVETPDFIEQEEPERNYDINEVLEKLRRDTEDNQENYRKLDEDNYRELKNLSNKVKNYKLIEKEKEELEEIKEDDDAGLLDDLKSDTVVGDAASIKKILEEEKEKNLTDTREESIYTTNFGLTKKDFEELKDLNKKVTRTNNSILILLIIVTIIIIVAFSIVIFM